MRALVELTLRLLWTPYMDSTKLITMTSNFLEGKLILERELEEISPYGLSESRTQSSHQSFIQCRKFSQTSEFISDNNE